MEKKATPKPMRGNATVRGTSMNIVEAIIHDLKGRQGMWPELDDEIEKELVEDLEDIAYDHIDECLEDLKVS